MEALRPAKQIAVAIFQARKEASGVGVGVGRWKDYREGSPFRTLAVDGILAQAKKDEDGG